jgi:hypothetical protein
LNRKLATLTAALLTLLILLSLFLAINWFGGKTVGRQFYVGVEYAYGNNQTAQVQVSQIQSLVDKVRDYTNLFVMGSLGLTFDRTALSEACDYIFDAKLNFIVLFTGLDKYSYNITEWIQDAKLKYGERFLGIYRYDEPGGNQLDNGRSQLINKTMVNSKTTYADLSKNFTDTLTFFPNYYLQFAPKVFTADYGLYWFDYKSNYSAIFAEFVGNESRQRHIALCRGAANAFGNDWGVIVTWKYSFQSPYLESGSELYTDLSLTYSSGAKYAIVFSYPTYPDNNQYGILQDEHFKALQEFWNKLHSNPASFGSNKAEVVYIVPRDYGFGFRSPTDTIWGLKPADALSSKIFYDTNNTLPSKYGFNFDILYDEPEVIAPLLKNYNAVYYWNQTIP